jgi:hypothetical protein
MLLASFWLHCLTAASLSHTSQTILMLIRPDRASTPITDSPAQIPSSSDLYDVTMLLHSQALLRAVMCVRLSSKSASCGIPRRTKPIRLWPR